jgi:predicted HicB family RNase H-like nuclease
MSTLSLRLPGSIHRHIREIAKKEGVSINQLNPFLVMNCNFINMRAV